MYLLNRLLKGSIRHGELTLIDTSGGRHVFSGEPGSAPDGAPLRPVVLRVNDPAIMRKFAINPELAAGEAYMDGSVTLEDGSTVRDLLALYFTNQVHMHSLPLQRIIGGVNMLLRRFHQSNRLGEARRHVAHHYDLGNDLYRLFLDENMVYSCAYFINDDDTLEEAQRNKMRLLAAKLNMKPGQRVLDIGSGWGDLAFYLARVAEVEVTGVTLSEEQYEHANNRARELGLSNRVRFELKDYRDLDEKFDRIVSVGMFEHVGAYHYDEFFGKAKAMLPEDGVMVLHSIGHMSPPASTSPFIRKYIFPGGYTPALSEVFQATERNMFWVTDLEILRLHYAKTLAHWHRRFIENRERIVEMYDDRFARMWEFYLVGSELSFRYGYQLVFHMQLSPTRDAVPIVRDYVTEKQREYRELEAEAAI